MARKSAVNRLDAAREAHAAASMKIAELVASRNAALLADRDDAAAKLLGEIETTQAVARGHADKIKLLEAEAERERADRIVHEHAALIGRFAKTLERSDGDLIEAADLIAGAWKKITTGIDKRERARAAFSVRSSHAQASAEAIEGCAMSAPAVTALLAYEFYRISARPLLGGRAGERTRPALPGALCPRLEWQLQPEKIVPFADRIKAASKFAVDTLRQEIGSGAEVAEPAPALVSAPLRNAADIQRELQAEAEARDAMLPPEIKTRARAPTNGAEPRERTAAEARLGGLLKRMAELADASINDPVAEAAYHAIGAEVATAQADVDAERGTRT